jgi:hypothetical protein
MAVRKNKVVRYFGLESFLRGDVKYWDGEEWVVLHIGNPGEVLTTHGIGNPPTWEPVSPDSSSSSSSSGITPTPPSSSSSSTEPSPSSSSSSFISLIFNPQGPQGDGTYVGQVMGDVHYFYGGGTTLGQTETHDRDGVAYDNLEYPFTAGWNWDDNASTDEVVWFAIDDPVQNKRKVITYSQKTVPFIGGMAAETIRYYSKELDYVSSSSASYTPTGSISYSVDATGGTIIGNGEFDFYFNSYFINGSSSRSEGYLRMGGTYWNGSTYVNVPETTLTPSENSPPTVAFSASLATREEDEDFIVAVTGDMSVDEELNDYAFWQLNTGAPTNDEFTEIVGERWYRLAQAGAKFGGIYFDIYRRLAMLRDQNVDLTGHPSLLFLGLPASEAALGVWGWYTDELRSSSSSSALLPPLFTDPHFIPYNTLVPSEGTMDQDINDFLQESGRSFYAPSNIDSILRTITPQFMNAIAMVHNLLATPGNTGWTGEILWDNILRINGSFPSSSASPVPTNCSLCEGSTTAVDPWPSEGECLGAASSICPDHCLYDAGCWSVCNTPNAFCTEYSPNEWWLICCCNDCPTPPE